MKALLLASLAGALVAGSLSCSDEAGGQGDIPSVEQLLARVETAMTRDGQVYHAIVDTESDWGDRSVDGRTEYWVDPAGGLARAKLEGRVSDGRTFSEETIVVGNSAFRVEPSRRVRAEACSGTRPAASTVLGCGDELASHIERAQWEGRTVFDLVSDIESQGGEETYRLTGRLHIDAVSFLPLGAEKDGTYDDGEVAVPYRATARFRSDFVPAGSLPVDFFEPAAIGFVAHDPEADLGQLQDVRVYWLGGEFAGAPGAPPLRLKSVYVPPDSGEYRALLMYRSSGDEFGPPVLSLEEFTRQEWESFLATSWENWWDQPCVERREIAIVGGRAILFMGAGQGRPAGACTGGSHNKFVAHVYFEETVVLVAANPGVCEGGRCGNGVYASEHAMETAIRSLAPRQP